MSTSWSTSEVNTLRKKYPTHPVASLCDELGRSESSVRRKAQRLEVSKHPQWRIIQRIQQQDTPDWDDEKFANFVTGFTAGEGSFIVSDRENRNPKFVFQIEMSDVDSSIIHEIEDFMGAGTVYEFEARQEDWNPTIQFSIQSVADHYTSTIPFFEKYPLRATHKRRQYRDWKRKLFDTFPVPPEHSPGETLK